MPAGAFKIWNRFRPFFIALFPSTSSSFMSAKSKQKQSQIWGIESPHKNRDCSRDSEKVTVWCALSGNEVIELYYFNDPTVNRESFLRLLSRYFLPMLPTFLENAILKQEGAPPHCSSQVKQLLYNSFSGFWIGKGDPTAWPPRSPDLTPLDFFLWGFLKNKVFHTTWSNLTQLKRRTKSAIRSVTANTLQKVWRNAHDCLNAIVREKKAT